ncbi:MAG: response regulator, partial [Bacteroidetes bacterium]|nr:response regulator [Bacteroidota bacterium]
MKTKILIVEDNPIIGEDLAAYMNEFGHEAVGHVTNAEETLRLLKEKSVDLILMDVGLESEIDGIQLASLIREKYKLPIIFLTALYD